MADEITITVSRTELAELVEALDSHAYWQLSDERYRRDGFVEEPGSDDADTAKRIVIVDSLHVRLETELAMLPPVPARPRKSARR